MSFLCLTCLITLLPWIMFGCKKFLISWSTLISVFPSFRMMRRCKENKFFFTITHTMVFYHKNTKLRYFERSQKWDGHLQARKSLPHKPTLLVPWCWTYPILNYEKINVYCRSHPVCGIAFWLPWADQYNRAPWHSFGCR